MWMSGRYRMEAVVSKHLKVGDLARQTGKSVRALRLYEELDLLHPVARSNGGFRLYDESAITRIRWIELLQETGLSLHQIQGLLKAWHGSRYGPEAMAVVRETFQTKLTETRQAIIRYETLARELEGTLEYLRTCQACRPPRKRHRARIRRLDCLYRSALAGGSGGDGDRLPTRAVGNRHPVQEPARQENMWMRGQLHTLGQDKRKENMSATPTLEIRNLHISIDGKPILKGLSLAVNKGEIHALMGPNGSGKSTLANALMGNPKYEVTEGTVFYKGEDVLELSPDERARKGIFLAFQYPTAIPGVSVANFLRNALNVRRKEMGEEKPIPPKEFRTLVKEKMALLRMDESFAGRYLNDGFSGGEKKRAEILQMAVLRPEIAVLDETDSGLDIDALRIVSEGVNALTGPDLGVLLITHYQRILNYIKPHFVHVLVDGRIVKSAGAELALELEKQGYDWIREDQAA